MQGAPQLGSPAGALGGAERAAHRAAAVRRHGQLQCGSWAGGAAAGAWQAAAGGQGKQHPEAAATGVRGERRRAAAAAADAGGSSGGTGRQYIGSRAGRDQSRGQRGRWICSDAHLGGCRSCPCCPCCCCCWCQHARKHAPVCAGSQGAPMLACRAAPHAAAAAAASLGGLPGCAHTPPVCFALAILSSSTACAAAASPTRRTCNMPGSRSSGDVCSRSDCSAAKSAACGAPSSCT